MDFDGCYFIILVINSCKKYLFMNYHLLFNNNPICMKKIDSLYLIA